MAQHTLQLVGAGDPQNRTRLDAEALLRSARDGMAWKNLPPEKNRGFFRIAAQMSVAVQAAMRRSIGDLYFDSADRYEDTARSYPVIVYSLSRVFSGRPRTEFAYDVHDPESIPAACLWTKAALEQTLQGIEQQLRAAREPCAYRYSPFRTTPILEFVQKNKRGLKALLYSDALIVEASVSLLAIAAERRRDRELMQAADAYGKAIHGTLRKFYNRRNLEAMAPALLAELARSVREAIQPPDAPLPAAAPAASLDLAA